MEKMFGGGDQMFNGTVANNVLAVGRINATGVQLLGTCFSVSDELLATPAHVTGPADKDLCIVLPTIKTLQEYQDTTTTQVNMIAVEIVKYDPIRDIAILSGAKSGIKMTLTYRLDGSDSANTGAPVSSLGYPHADHGRLILTEQRSSVGARIILAQPRNKDQASRSQCPSETRTIWKPRLFQRRETLGGDGYR
jgi:hypothetical protein